MKYLLFTLILLVQLSYAAPLKLTTFNIKWFGTGGWSEGTIENETRIPALKEFWQDYLSDSDVIIFQEIVNTEVFANEVAPENYNCLSYDHKWTNHQHVMICYKNKFHFEKEEGDDNYIIDDVAMWRYRPAISGVLTDLAGNRLIHIIGVHLKARSYDSPKRVIQVERIANAITSYTDDLPVAVLGDFNAYDAPYNGQEENDTTLFSNMLSPLGVDWVEHSFGTYATSWRKRTLDHIWLSSSLEISEELSVFGACNATRSDLDLLDISVYNKEISDHCPTSVGVELLM